MAKAAARLEDLHECALMGGPILSPGAPSVLIDQKIASKLADKLGCNYSNDLVTEGSATVLWEQLPATIEGSATLIFGGKVLPPCSPNLQIGGPTFAVPKLFDIQGTQDERNKIIRDLYLLWTTPSGKELFRRLQESGKRVTIWPTPNPGDASMRPYFPDVYGIYFGAGVGSNVYYNLDTPVGVYDRNGKLMTCPPQIVLGHELTHSLDGAEGTMALPWTDDPNPPKSQPDIPKVEARAIGTGSQTNEYPSENSFRRDLGLPERDNHNGTTSQSGYGPTTLRPGK